MLVDGEVRAALKRCRMLLGAIRSPKLRRELAEQLDDAHPVERPFPIRELDWFANGEVDTARIAEDHACLGSLLSDEGLLAYDAIGAWPERESDRPALVRAVLERAFRAESRGWMTEVELNARLSMVFFDPSGLRRYAVDSGLLERTPDGSRYWLAAPLES